MLLLLGGSFSWLDFPIVFLARIMECYNSINHLTLITSPKTDFYVVYFVSKYVLFFCWIAHWNSEMFVKVKVIKKTLTFQLCNLTKYDKYKYYNKSYSTIIYIYFESFIQNPREFIFIKKISPYQNNILKKEKQNLQ